MLLLLLSLLATVTMFAQTNEEQTKDGKVAEEQPAKQPVDVVVYQRIIAKDSSLAAVFLLESREPLKVFCQHPKCMKIYTAEYEAYKLEAGQQEAPVPDAQAVEAGASGSLFDAPPSSDSADQGSAEAQGSAPAGSENEQMATSPNGLSDETTPSRNQKKKKGKKKNGT